MKKLGLLGFVLWISVFLWTKDSFAHMRRYVWTEVYNTLPRGTFEVESWTTLKVPDGNRTNANTWQYQGELEYGITDHWNVAHYERWKTKNKVGPDDSTVYEGFKFETKYRFGEKGKYWLDPLLYLELATDVREKHRANELEGKLVLSKDIGKFNAAYNQIIESEVDNGGRTKHEFRVAAGYEILPGFHAGGEFVGQHWAPGSNRNELSMGPTIAYEHKYFWIAAGGLFGLNHAADDKEARLIVGIPF